MDQDTTKTSELSQDDSGKSKYTNSYDYYILNSRLENTLINLKRKVIATCPGSSWTGIISQIHQLEDHLKVLRNINKSYETTFTESQSKPDILDLYGTIIHEKELGKN